jgi:hypothetical protein
MSSERPVQLTEEQVEKFFAGPNKYKTMPPYPVISANPGVGETLLSFSAANLFKIAATGTAFGVGAGVLAARIPGPFWTFGRGFAIGFAYAGVAWMGMHEFDEAKARLMGWRPNGFDPVIPGYTHYPGTLRAKFDSKNLPPAIRSLNPKHFFEPILRHSA